MNRLVAPTPPAVAAEQPQQTGAQLSGRQLLLAKAVWLVVAAAALALFAAGIHPGTPCRRLSPARIARLANEIRAVLRKAVRAGGSSLRDFVDADGAPGDYQGSHLVYGRAGLPCTQCGVALRSMRVSGRATVFCPRCQRTGSE